MRTECPPDEQCPVNEFEQGIPAGNCWGDGHYECKNCIHYRSDFYRLGQDYIDFVHQMQNGIQILTLKQNIKQTEG